MPGLVGYMLLFLGVGIFFIFIHLMAGKLIRPARPHAEKMTIYECGEPTIGSAWIQFDLRFYVVAVFLFVIFDVEVAFFFPWAVVFGKANALANDRLSVEQRQALSAELTPSYADSQAPIPAATAHQLAWLAFWDILIFFGVLLVGFAYLWKRGDLDWVRSTAAERAAARPQPLATQQPLAGSANQPEPVAVS